MNNQVSPTYYHILFMAYKMHFYPKNTLKNASNTQAEVSLDTWPFVYVEPLHHDVSLFTI